MSTPLRRVGACLALIIVYAAAGSSMPAGAQTVDPFPADPGTSSPCTSGAVRHCYSVAWESTGGNMTGVSQFRPDMGYNLTGTSHVAVYQSMWVNDGIGNFFELGSAYCQSGGCNTGSGVINNSSWYTFWCILGTCNLSGQWGIGPGPNHTFYIARFGASNWLYQIDATLVLNQPTFANLAFARADAGLEVYSTSTGGTLPAYNSSGLSATQSGGGWFSWSGRDGTYVNAPTMCGSWAGSSHTSRNFGRASSC